ncbi:hypothetical protein AQJ67_41710 [Streptomyces caeruleatus]|uniref:Uncharacterized protein n=1 Tax=Streptomyces caeruleatus TaxID=661399 RepID=A0A101TFX4_9ACTN|nr:hypothetical protein AQJ67_41710 [Streptomyces caeruleatus]
MRTSTLSAPRDCDGLITDPDDAVFLWHEPDLSGPGWDAYAHREHAGLVKPDPTPERLLARILIVRTLSDG